MADCRKLGIVTAAFYVLGFLQDDWSSIAATIDYSIALGSTVAQFKLLTPYPGTPMWRQLEPARLRERTGNGSTASRRRSRTRRCRPTSCDSCSEAAYNRFYLRPSYLAHSCVSAAGDCAPPSGSIPACSPGTNAASAQLMAKAVTC